MSQLINELQNKAMRYYNQMDAYGNAYGQGKKFDEELFARLIIHECLNIIEQYPIPVGNSAAGELAAEWTYTALEQIRDTIKETFGVTDETSEPKSIPQLTDKERAEFRFNLDSQYAFYGVKK